MGESFQWSAIAAKNLGESFQWSAIATASAAVVALIVGAVTVYQRSRSENRAEWWRRLEWAIEHTHAGDDANREAGLAVLLHLVKSPLAGKNELKLARDLARQVLIRRYGGV